MFFDPIVSSAPSSPPLAALSNALAKRKRTASASGAARNVATSRLFARQASSQTTSTKNVFADASAHPSYVSATHAYVPSRSGLSVATAPSCAKDADAPPVQRAPRSALDGGAETTDQTVTNASPPRHGRPSSGSRLNEPSRIVFLKHRGVFGDTAAYVDTRAPASSAEKKAREGVPELVTVSFVGGGPETRASARRGVSSARTTSSASNTAAAGTGASLQSTRSDASLLAVWPAHEPTASTRKTYSPGPSGTNVSFEPRAMGEPAAKSRRQAAASEASRSGGGGGGGGDGGGGGKSYLRIHSGMLSSMASRSTSGAGGASGSTHGVYGTGTVALGARVTRQVCVTKGLSHVSGGTVVLTRDTFSSTACPIPGSASYASSPRSRDTFASSNRRLLSTTSSHASAAEAFAPAAELPARATARTNETRSESTHAGGWNANVSQCGGGGDGGDGGGDGPGGGDGGDGGGDGGGRTYRASA